jgi:xanthine dehydrogenase small subunit
VLETEAKATIVAGSTDVGLWVTKHMRDIAPVVFIGDRGPAHHLRRNGVITIGAGVTYTEAFSLLARRIPALGPLIDRIGGEQVRNMGTIGGNIANGSPIGDTPPPLIALDAKLTLRKGKKRRTISLEEVLHRLRQAGSPARRIRRGRACADAARKGRKVRGLTRSPSAATKTSPRRSAPSA